MSVCPGAPVLCRLCAGPADRGSPLFSGPRPLAAIVNAYLPLKVSDDGRFCNIICPGCNIQLEATAQFFDLVINGQKRLKELKRRDVMALNKDTHFLDEGEDIIVEVLEDGSIYAKNHTISLRMDDCAPPKRKRGRPAKKKITPVVEENVIAEPQMEVVIDPSTEEDTLETGNKRRRNAPRKFTESIHGKELEQIFIEEGLVDENDSSRQDKKWNSSYGNKSEVIGYVEAGDGTNLDKLVYDKKKSRGPAVQRSCNECSLKFTNSSTHMAHIATYHSQISDQDIQQNIETTIEHSDLIPQDSSIFLSIQDNIVINPIMQLNANEDLPDNVFFGTGPSMPDITSEMMNNDKNITDNVMDVVSILAEQAPRDSELMNVIADLQTNNQNNELSISNAHMEANSVNISNTVNNKPDFKYECTECSKTFTTKQNCEVHIRASHNGERPYKCPLCDLTFPYKLNVKRHLMSHKVKENGGFACDICGKILNHPSSVLYHKQTVHNNGERFVCNKCNRPFRHRQLLLKHQMVHKDERPFSCKVCNARFKTKAYLIKHSVIHTGVKKYFCETCGQRYAHRSNLTMHLRWHLGQKPFSCSVCSKTFSQNGNLKEHMRTHTGEKPFYCAACQRSFTTSSRYRVHMKSHKMQNTTWKCEQCGKLFARKATLDNHIKMHNGEKPFECTICNRRFLEKSAMYKHQRLHNGDKPFTCNICNRKFADNSNLSKHKRLHREAIEQNISSDLRNDDLGVLDSIDTTLLNDNRVFCVTFDENNGEQPATLHIVDESEMVNLNACELYENEADLLVTEHSSINDPVPTEAEIQSSSTIFDNFVDEDGNPIQFTFQDGTQFTVASSDGKLLQIQNDEYILSTGMEEIEQTSEQLVQVSSEDVLSQYFTIA